MTCLSAEAGRTIRRDEFSAILVPALDTILMELAATSSLSKP